MYQRKRTCLPRRAKSAAIQNILVAAAAEEEAEKAGGGKKARVENQHPNFEQESHDSSSRGSNSEANNMLYCIVARDV